MHTSSNPQSSAEPYNKDLSLILHPDFDTCSLSASQQDKGALVLHKLSLFPFLQDWTDNYGAYINHAPFLIGLSIETPNRRREFTDITYNVLKCGMPSNGRRSFCKKDKLCAYCASVKGKNLQAKLLTNAPWTDGYRFYSLTYSYRNCFSLDLTTSDQLLHHWTLAKDYVQALYKSKLIHGYSLSEELAVNNIQGAWVRPHSHFLIRCDQELSLAELPPVDPSVSLDLVEISTVKHYINQTHYMCKPLDYATQYQIELSLGADPSFLNSQLQFLLERYLYTISKRRKVVSAGCFRPVYNRCVDRIPKARTPKKRVRTRKSKSPTKELKPVAEVAKIEKDTDTDMNSEDIFNATTLQLKQAAAAAGFLKRAAVAPAAVPTPAPAAVPTVSAPPGPPPPGKLLRNRQEQIYAGFKGIVQPDLARRFTGTQGSHFDYTNNNNEQVEQYDSIGDVFGKDTPHRAPFQGDVAFSDAERNNSPASIYNRVPGAVDEGLLYALLGHSAAKPAALAVGGANSMLQTPFSLPPAASKALPFLEKTMGRLNLGANVYWNGKSADSFGRNPLVDFREYADGLHDRWDKPAMTMPQRALQSSLLAGLASTASFIPGSPNLALLAGLQAADYKVKNMSERLANTSSVYQELQDDTSRLAHLDGIQQKVETQLRQALEAQKNSPVQGDSQDTQLFRSLLNQSNRERRKEALRVQMSITPSAAYPNAMIKRFAFPDQGALIGAMQKVERQGKPSEFLDFNDAREGIGTKKDHQYQPGHQSAFQTYLNPFNPEKDFVEANTKPGGLSNEPSPFLYHKNNIKGGLPSFMWQNGRFLN